MKIVLYGDSITDMDRIREPNSGVRSYGFGYPFFIAGELFAENPNRYDIINNGIGGNRVVDLYARIKRDVWNCEPDVLSILIGINDVWHDLKPNGLANGVDIETYEKFYRMIIEDTVKRFPDIKIILLEPFYLKGSATAERYVFFQRVKEYAKIVKSLRVITDLHSLNCRINLILRPKSSARKSIYTTEFILTLQEQNL